MAGFLFIDAEKYNKPALTFRQQLELLESRGLKIGDRAAAEAFLADTNYYRLSAYCIPFQSKRDVFVPNATFTSPTPAHTTARPTRRRLGERKVVGHAT